MNALARAWHAWQAAGLEGSSIKRDQAWRHFLTLVNRAAKCEHIRKTKTLEKRKNLKL